MIMVSACLLGTSCKYNGGHNLNQAVASYLKDKPIILICPEMLAGLGIPRNACEIQGGDGHDVLSGKARVVSLSGKDLTAEFIMGAESCLNLALLNEVSTAILKERSPSCGCRQIYDGCFSNSIVKGSGVTASLLEKNKIKIMSEEDFKD
ncbi:MAG: DUF523 domain-containing protein [Chitinophagales bacterium]